MFKKLFKTSIKSKKKGLSHSSSDVDALFLASTSDDISQTGPDTRGSTAAPSGQKKLLKTFIKSKKKGLSHSSSDVDALFLPSTSDDISQTGPDTRNSTAAPSGQVQESRSDTSPGIILKLKRKNSSKDLPLSSKSVSFADTHSNEIDQSVTNQSASKEPRAFRVFTIEDSVQIFYIDSSGVVETQEDTWSLHIVRFSRRTGRDSTEEEDKERTIQPAAFLHVGVWLYPLYPGCSPVLITAYGTYIFPDLRNNKGGCSVALVLPEYLSLDDRETFEVLLDYYAFVEDAVNRLVSQPQYLQSSQTSWWKDDQDERPNRQARYSVAASIRRWFKTIVSFIMLIVQLLVWIIHYLGWLIRLRGRRASQHLRVDPNILQGVIYAKSATSKGVLLTSYIANTLHQEAVNLSRLLTPVKMPRFIDNTVVGSALKLTFEVSASTVGGVNDVYTSLHYASTVLIDAVFDETIKTMEYRYGEEYGHLTKEAFQSAINVREALSNTEMIKSLAFVPNTIDVRLRERLPNSETDLSKTKEWQVGESSRGEKTRQRRTDSMDMQQGATQQESQSSKADDKVLNWAWSSPSLADQASVQKKIRDTDSDTETKISKKPSLEFRKKLTSDPGHGSKTEVNPVQLGPSGSVDHFNPLMRDSFDSTGTQEPNAPLEGKSSSTSQLIWKTGSSTSLRSSRQSRSNLSLVGETRRESLFLSNRRQSMHVTAVMANMAHEQFREIHSSTPGLALCCRKSNDNLFREAAISITRAKIRRLHREMAAEKFLVVVKLTANILRSE